MQCQDIDLAMATAAVNAAAAKANELGIKQNIAVVDRGANLKAFVRMDGCLAWQH
jgi:uncharacterized protein GlcG (DUF336 family)